MTASRPGTAAHVGAAPRTAAAAPRIGSKLADFALPASDGALWRLRSARGHHLVLYFYPRDNTPGCSLEAAQFAALAPRFERANTQIVGISRDTVAAHARFCSQLGLPFTLLADVDGMICERFDVIRDKNLYGRKVRGIERSSFLLDATGVLRHEWRRVKPDGHALVVLTAAQTL